ncbi:MAG: hypothetical protein RBR71_04350 [Gudongella sp.]|nr:hypothetical protein [Gudongella sp.]
MFSDVEIKIKRKNKIFFSRKSKSLLDLVELMELQNHRIMVMWALDCASIALKNFEDKYPDEKRPRICLEMCDDWARGKVKMPEAKRSILDCHAVVNGINDSEYQALCHAIGQAGSTIHVKSHALGLPIYELTAIVLRYGEKDFYKPVSEKIECYYNRLLYWQDNTDILDFEWAKFLKD